MPGNSKSLWQAVKLAKNLGANNIPKNMSLNGEGMSGHEISEGFAEFL